MDLVLNHANGHTCVGLARLNEVVDPRFCPEMRVGNNRVLLLVGPNQVANVVRGDGQNGVGGCNADGGGHTGAQQEVAVACDDGAGHGGNKDVQGAGEDPLAGLLGRGERADGACERVLEAQGLGQGAVDGLLAADGLAVQGHARNADLLGEAVGGRWAVGGLGREVLGGLRQGGRRGLCGVEGELVVDGLAVLGGQYEYRGMAGQCAVACRRTKASPGCSSA